MLTARGTVTIRPKEVIPIYREEWDATVEDYKYDLLNRDFVSRAGNLYHAKEQRPGEFIPAGIAPDSVEGAKYWEMFNALKPTATNFLVITDEKGTPRTLMSGGRIQTEFLNIGSLNMSETRLWGGAEPMTGKGLALVNDPDDRKFVVYNDAANYVEMFQRTNEWGMVGRTSSGGELFRLGQKYTGGKWVESNFISGWKMSTTGFQNNNFEPPTYRTEGYGSGRKYYVEGGSGSKLFPDGGLMIMPSGTGILPLSSGMMQAGLIKAEGTNAYIMGMEIIARNTDSLASLGQVTALKLSAKNEHSSPLTAPRALHVENGEVLVENGDVIMNGVNNYLVGTNVPKAVAWTGASTRWLSANETMVFVNNGTTKINIILPDPRNLRPGHTIIFIPWQSSGDFGIVPNSAAPGKIVYKGSLYEWALGHSVSGGRTATIHATFVALSGGQYLWVAYAMDQPGIKYGNG